MQLEKFVIQKLLGANTNAVDRGEGRDLQPDDLFNLKPNRTGGLQTIGKLVPISSSQGLTTFDLTGSLVGYDASGLVSFLDDANGDLLANSKVQLFYGTAWDTISLANILGIPIVAHVPTVGVVANPYAYVVRTSSGVEARTSSANYSFTTSTSLNSQSDFVAGDSIWLLFLTYVVTKNGMRVVTDQSITYFFLQGNDRIIYDIPTLSTGHITDVYLSRRKLPTTSEPEPSISSWRLVDTHKSASTNNFIYVEPQGAVFPTASSGPFFIVSPYLTTAVHNKRMWTVASTSTTKYITVLRSFQIDVDELNNNAPIFQQEEVPGLISDNASDLTLVYSEIGWVNLADQNATFTIPATSSTKITALVSSASNEFGEFGGLLVFCENETWVVTGDPALTQGVDISLYPINIGTDAGVIPAMMGFTVFTVWKGRVYAVQQGKATDISKDVFDRDDKFIQVVLDTEEEALVCKKAGGDRWRYYFKHDHWVRDLEPLDALGQIIPINNLLPFPDGLRYVGTPAGSSSKLVYVVNLTTPDIWPYITYKHLDLGDPASLDYINMVVVYMDGIYSGTSYLYYKTSKTQSGVGDWKTAGGLSVTGRKLDDGEILFMLPHGLRSRATDIRIKFSGIGTINAIEPPIEIGFVRGYRVR